jgi:hypothetical protein
MTFVTRTHAVIVAAVISAMVSIGAGAAIDPAAEKFWPQWRGPCATGASKTADPPIDWSETKNVRWKVEIPGRGSASPIVWGDKLFVLTAIPAGSSGAAAHQPRGGIQPPGRRAGEHQRDARVAWSLDHDTAYVPSPLFYDGTLYFLKTHSGVLSPYDATTGKPHYQLQRLEGVPNVFASPVAAQGRISCRP